MRFPIFWKPISFVLFWGGGGGAVRTAVWIRTKRSHPASPFSYCSVAAQSGGYGFLIQHVPPKFWNKQIDESPIFLSLALVSAVSSVGRSSLTLQETRSIPDSMNIPKIEFIS